MDEKKPSAAFTTMANAIKSLRGGKPVKPNARPPRPKLLISIVNWGEGKKVRELLAECSVALNFSFKGLGTARSQMLDYLGIGETEKSITLSLIPEADEDRIIRELRSKMLLYLAGRGISFTVPLTGVSGIVSKGITGAAANKTFSEDKVMKAEDRKYDLVIVSVAVNHIDEAMEAARAAGASGGTIVRAHAADNEKAEQFIGISLVPVQEVAFILTKKENTQAIMNALSEKVGLKTEASGVIFSVPVDRTAGISMAEEPTPPIAASEKGEGDSE